MPLSQLLDRLAKEIISAMQRDINNNSGALSKSITSKIVNDSSGTEMSITMLRYGQYVDSGTRGQKTGLPNRKMPPIEKLNGWAENKGLNVWAVAKHIQLYGTKPHPFIHNFEDIINENIGEISEALGMMFQVKFIKH